MLRKLEKYDLLEEIGHGGMATVYRARDTRLDRLVAVKVMHPHLRKAPEAKSRFAREARSVARLRHENILEIYDYSGEDSEESYISAELLTGPTLKKFAEDHLDMPAEIAACFCIEIARALSAAHEKGIVHRDVKPENVLLHDDRMVKLTDFGIAQMVDAQSMTATGQILGSPGHMAPEQVEGRECDERSDIFSLGTVLYFLATNRLPFTGRNPHTVLKRIMDADFADPLRVRPSIGGKLRAIIVKALSRDPAERHASAKELGEELESFVGLVGIDEPARMLGKYMKDPAAVTEELRKKAIEVYTREGERAADRDQIPEALDCFNRVLALDEGNEQVLNLIERLGRQRARRRGLMMAAGVLLGVSGLGAIGYAALTPPDEVARGGEHGINNDTEADSGVFVIVPETNPEAEDSGSAVAVNEDSGQIDAGARVRPVGIPAPVRSNEPRLVQFRPRPMNVYISVDGGPFREFTVYTQDRLTPGPHRIAVRRGANADRWKDKTFPVTIPARAAGDEDAYPVSLPLPYADGGLYVICNVPCRVQVGDAHAGPGLRNLVSVPMREETQTHAYRVTAERHQGMTRSVELRAGGQVTERVTLEVEATEGTP